MMQFDEAEANAYRKRLTVMAFRSDCPATYHKSWGVQEMGGPHMVMVSCGADGVATDDIYGCAMNEFGATYEPVPGRPHVYRKVATIEAYQVDHDFEFQTMLTDGTTEVECGHGRAGDWLARNPGGEVYAIGMAAFAAMYEEVGEEAEPAPTMVTQTADVAPEVDVFGDPDIWQLLCKAQQPGEWMKSTKAMNVSGGVVLQVTTEKGGFVAEALCFVPGVAVSGEHGSRRLVRYRHDD